MRYKKGITQTHIQNPQEFRNLMSGFLTSSRDQCLSMVASKKVHYFIDFSRKQKDICVTSFLSMPLEDPYQTQPFEVWNEDGNSKGYFEFQHVEIASQENSFFLK